jgi:vitamin B12 transporter
MVAVFSSALKVNANYTFTQVEEPLSRLIPKHKEIFRLSQHRALSLLLITSLLIKGKMDGGTFATTAVLLDYQLVNTMAKYDVIKTD